jgi:hypothetical protein
MSVALLVLGILLTAAGVVAIGFGIPINEIALGTTLILAGTTAAVGGLVVVGLAAAVAELSRLTSALRAPRLAPRTQAQTAPEAQPAPEAPAQDQRPPLPQVAEVAAAATATLDVSASAIERLRSSIPRPDRVVPDAVPLSPNGSQAATQTEQMPPVAQPAGAPAAEAREPRLDFLLRSRPARPPQPASFDSVWPKRPGRDGDGQPAVEERPLVAAAAAEVAEPAPLPAAPAEPTSHPEAVAHAPAPRSVAVLKSGVVDGMAYTLYADGSIEAQLPQGTVRFGSIAELRAHIESNS